jgi:hypothetical protein
MQARNKAMLNAVSREACATQYHPSDRCNRASADLIVAHDRGQGQKSYWGDFQRNVTVKRSPSTAMLSRLIVRPGGALGQGFINVSGSEQQ